MIDIDDVKVGDKLVADRGFKCLKPGEVVTVAEFEGALFVPCKMNRHYLKGQMDAEHQLVGFYKYGK